MTFDKQRELVFYITLISFIVGMYTAIGEYPGPSPFYDAMAAGVMLAGMGYFITHVLLVDNAALKRWNTRNVLALDVLFPILLTVANMALILAWMSSVPYFGIEAVVGTLRTVGIYLLFLLMPLFLVIAGTYFAKFRKKYALGAALILIALIATVIYFYAFVTYFQTGDELYISLMSVKAIAAGQNPYPMSFANGVYGVFDKIGGTMTMGNALVGTPNYPALYFLISAPFYFISQQTLHNLMYVDMKLETSIFFFLLLLGVAWISDRKRLFEFRFGFIAAFAFMLASIASPVNYVMLLFLIIAYARMDSRYSFVPLGLAISIQEEVWIPAALLLLYAINRDKNSGIRMAIGAVMVFALINGAFVVTGPYAFFRDVFSPLDSLLPFGTTAIGSAVLLIYHVPVNASAFVFAIAACLSAVLLLYWDKKELVPVLSMLPMVMLFHSLIGYYTLYLFFAAFALTSRDRRAHGTGWITKWMRRNTALSYVAVAALFIIGIGGVYAYHLVYVSNFDIAVNNQSVSYVGNNTVYTAQVHYGNMSNNTLYLLLQGHSNHTLEYGIYGFNQSLLGEGPTCSDSYTCYMNYNRILLNGSRGTYDLRAVIPGNSVSDRVTYMHAILYDSKYVYYTENVGNSSAYST